MMLLSITGSAECARLNQTRAASADWDSSCRVSLWELYAVTAALSTKYVPRTSSRLRRYLQQTVNAMVPDPETLHPCRSVAPGCETDQNLLLHAI